MSPKIVITGATKGIGKAIALKFAAHGFSVAVCARTQKDLKQLKTEIEKTSPAKTEVLAFKCDVSDKKQLRAFADSILQQWGAVDILVNNAGIFLPGQVYKEKEGTLETLIETNLYSAYYLSRWLLPPMIKKKRGHIFNMCSVASIGAYHNGGSYSISKFALLGLSKAQRAELKEFNIRVTSLIVGATYTDSWAASGLPEQRFMKAGDIAQAAWDIYNLSQVTVVEDILLRPIQGDI